MLGCSLFVRCRCLLFVVYCSLVVARWSWLLFAVCCVLFVGRCSLFVVCCSLFVMLVIVVCCLPFVIRRFFLLLEFAGCWLLAVACYWLFVIYVC